MTVQDIPHRAALCRRGGIGMSSSDLLMLLYILYEDLHLIFYKRKNYPP